MVRWLLALALSLSSGAALAQQSGQDTPMTAAQAAAKARGEKGDVVNPDANRTPAPGAMPSKQEVQQAQDHCDPNDSSCAQRLRTPAQAPAPATSSSEPPPATQDSPSRDAPGLFGSTLVGLGSPAQNAPGGLAGAAAAPTHPIELSAYFILNGQWVQADPSYLYVGRNNGFSLGDARIELTGKPTDNLWLFLSIDGAVANRTSLDPAQDSRVVALKDAYGVWSPGYHLRVEAGQFKAPQDVEHLLEETEIKFPTRSLLTDGLHAPAGHEVAGLSLDRQIGVALGTDVIALPFGSVAGQVMLSNGNGPNTLVNATSAPGVIGRIAIGVLGIVSLGADAYFMPQATGTQPDLFRDNWFGAGGDVRVEWNGLHLMGLLQYRNTYHLTTSAPDERSFGYTLEAAYKLPGAMHFLEPAVRYASLNPSNQLVDLTTGSGTLGQVQSLDAALNFYAPGTGAARLSVAYVHRMENSNEALENDGVDMSLQVSF